MSARPERGGLARSAAALAVALMAILATASPTRAARYEIWPGDDLAARLETLGGTDEVIVHAGTYSLAGHAPFVWAGLWKGEILVRAADGERPVLVGDGVHDVLDVSGSDFTLRGFEITGGRDGIALGESRDVTIEDVWVHGVDGAGISCTHPGATCTSLTIRSSEIGDVTRRGGGIVLGSDDGASVVRDSLIVGNFVHDLADVGPGATGVGIAIHSGSFGNFVRDNVLVRVGRAGITAGGFTDALGSRNRIERNLIWRATGDGIAVVGQVVVRNNLFFVSGAGLFALVFLSTPFVTLVALYPFTGLTSGRRTAQAAFDEIEDALADMDEGAPAS